MTFSRRSFLLLGSQLNPYEGPERGKLSEVGFADDISGEKKIPPVPVGAKSAALFRTRCVGCFKCIEACPRKILKPSASGKGFGRPALDFRLGWCRPACNRCAEACPAGAILPKEKAFQPNLAVWHRDRCLAATGRDECHACERHCPTKAITLKERVPVVDPAKCIGCGACEYYCPARPKVAMSVEGRS